MQMRFTTLAILDCEADLILAFFSHDGLAIEYHIALKWPKDSFQMRPGIFIRGLSINPSVGQSVHGSNFLENQQKIDIFKSKMSNQAIIQSIKTTCRCIGLMDLLQEKNIFLHYIINSRKSVTWSAVPHAPLLVSYMLAIQLVLQLGGSDPVADNDLWYHHTGKFSFFRTS